MTPATLRELLAGLVDYAGLFPPAALAMDAAAEEYARQRAAEYAWMLGSFVVPAARLPELDRARQQLGSAAGQSPWPVSALIGEDMTADLAAVRASSHGASALVVQSVEARVAGADEVERVAARLTGPWTLYIETTPTGDPREFLAAVRGAGARAKVRAGGTVPGAFPSTAHLARFIAGCATAGVAFKATAGLHHPLRDEYRLTYERDASSATMFGFLTVFLAGCFAEAGVPLEVLADLLEERDARTIRFDDARVTWRDAALTLEQIVHARREFAMSFGSCSFAEPVHDLHTLALL